MTSVLKIDLRQDYVTFELDGHHQRLPTRIYVAPGYQKRGFQPARPPEATILGFGSSSDKPGGLRVDLFAPDNLPEGAPDKGDCLAAFMLHAVKLLFEGLRSVLTAAGAKTCQFL